MRTKINEFILTGALVILLNLHGNAQVTGSSATGSTQYNIFPKGKSAPAENFTGTVWVSTLVANDSTFHSVMSNVTFEPNARTNWHSHPAGQILLVTQGTGYHQERGKPIQLIHKGDVVKCLPNVEHWHGASPDSQLTHVAVNPNTQNGIVTWLNRVTDEEYKKFK